MIPFLVVSAMYICIVLYFLAVWIINNRRRWKFFRNKRRR